MKCPRCGSEMTLDTHRKYPLEMCYNCGYMEGRNMGPLSTTNNFSHLKSLNLNEAAAFLAEGLKLDPKAVSTWLDEAVK